MNQNLVKVFYITQRMQRETSHTHTHTHTHTYIYIYIKLNNYGGLFFRPLALLEQYFEFISNLTSFYFFNLILLLN